MMRLPLDLSSGLLSKKTIDRLDQLLALPCVTEGKEKNKCETGKMRWEEGWIGQNTHYWLLEGETEKRRGAREGLKVEWFNFLLFFLSFWCGWDFLSVSVCVCLSLTLTLITRRLEQEGFPACHLKHLSLSQFVSLTPKSDGGPNRVEAGQTLTLTVLVLSSNERHTYRHAHLRSFPFGEWILVNQIANPRVSTTHKWRGRGRGRGRGGERERGRGTTCMSFSCIFTRSRDSCTAASRFIECIHLSPFLTWLKHGSL